MEQITILSLISALLVLIVAASGIVLRKSGVPYRKGLMTVHKLSVVAVIVLAAVIYKQHFEVFKFRGTGLLLFIFSDLSLLFAIVTGGLLSFDRFYSIGLKITHRLISWSAFLFIPLIWLYCH